MPELFRTQTDWDTAAFDLPGEGAHARPGRKIYLALLAVVSFNVFALCSIVTFYLLLRRG